MGLGYLEKTTISYCKTPRILERSMDKHQESILFVYSSRIPHSKADHFEGSVHVQVSMLERVAGRMVQRNASEIWFGFIDHRRGCSGAVCLSALVD